MHLVFSFVRRVNSAPGHVPTVPLGLNLVASGGNESSFPSFFVLPGGIAETKRLNCKFDRIPSLPAKDLHAEADEKSFLVSGRHPDFFCRSAAARRARRADNAPPQCGRDDNNDKDDSDMIKRVVFAALWVLDIRVLADSLYTVLGLTHSATAPEIKKAYYKLAQKLHPDKVRPEEKENAAVRFKMVAEAHATLSSPERRSLYDSEQLGGSPRPSSRGAAGQRTTGRGLTTVPGVEELRRVCTGGRDNQLHRYMILALYDTRRRAAEPRQRRPRCAPPSGREDPDQQLSPPCRAVRSA